MPKALLLVRPSGLYARFLIPVDLQALLGRRFVVRPLYLPSGDAARLASARLGLALSNLFADLRAQMTMDDNEAERAEKARQRMAELDALLPLESTAKARARLFGVSLGNGLRFESVDLETPEDHEAFATMVAKFGGQAQQASPVSAASGDGAMPPAKSKARLMLGKAIADHLADLERAGLHSKTVLESKHSLRLFAGAVGSDAPVSALTQDHVRAFFDLVRWWPANATKRLPYRDLVDVNEVVAAARANGEAAPAAWTQAKHRQRLSVFFVSLVAGGHIERNPMKGVRALETPDTEDTGAPFTTAQLQAMFEPAPFVEWASKWPHRWFGTMLGLYSGARVTEVAQLRIDDVSPVDGVQGFYVRAAGEGQRVKNKNSRRFVPLAAPVLAAGFLDYVAEVKAAGHVRVFPNLPGGNGLSYGRQLSRQFSTYAKARGVDEKGQGFHGFRHTFASLLDAAGATPSAIGALTGHARGQSVLERHYIDRGSLPDRVATLGRFVPPVELPAYTPGQFSEQLKRAAVLDKRAARAAATKAK